MAKESTLTLTLKVDDQGTVVLDKFTKSIQKASDDVGKMSKSMQVVSVSAFINIAQQAINAGERVFGFARSIASAGNDIKRMSRVFNMTTEEFQKWSYVTKMADVDMEGFGQGFKFLTRSMSEALQGSGDAAKAFELLGINLKNSTGRTKDQQTVMMETIGSLERFEDGVNRDALMLAIFGRGWMSVKPLIDQGTKAIEANRQEADRLNTILGKDVIKSLSESEDSFKRWSMTLNVAKMEIFEPMVKILGSMIERILALKKAWAEGGIGGVYRDIVAAQEAERAANRPAAASGTLASLGITLPYSKSGKKPEAPGLPGKSTIDIVKEVQSAMEGVIAAENERGEIFMAQRELIEGGWSKEKDIVEEVREELARLERETNEWGEITVGRQELVEAGWEAADKRMKESRKSWNDFGQSISENFNTMFVDTLTNGFKNIGDVFKKFLSSLLSSFISAIGKMIVEWLLFESVTTGGKTEKTFLGGGSGLGSIFGGIVKGITGLSFAGGTNYVPRTGLAMLHQGETVIPADKNGGESGNTVIMYIEATDVDSFERKYGGAVTKIIHRNKKSAMARN